MATSWTQLSTGAAAAWSALSAAANSWTALSPAANSWSALVAALAEVWTEALPLSGDPSRIETFPETIAIDPSTITGTATSWT